MPPEDRIRLQHMIDAAEAGMGFVNGRQRADLDEEELPRLVATLKLALAEH